MLLSHRLYTESPASFAYVTSRALCVPLNTQARTVLAHGSFILRAKIYIRTLFYCFFLRLERYNRLSNTHVIVTSCPKLHSLLTGGLTEIHYFVQWEIDNAAK